MADHTTEMEPDRTVQHPEPEKRRWLTIEYFVYYGIMLIGFIFFFYNGKISCDEINEGKRSYSHVRKGWIPGRLIDTRDFQYEKFRSYFPYFVALLVGHLLLSWTVRCCSRIRRRGGRWCLVPAHPYAAATVSLLVGIGFAVFLHRAEMVYIAGLVLFNYLLARVLTPTPLLPFVTWGYILALLCIREFFPREVAEALFGAQSPWLRIVGSTFRALIAAPSYVHILSTRLISFNFDYYWAVTRKPPRANLENKAAAKRRMEYHLPLRQYNMFTYCCYVFYPPLYFAGPIICFNDFVSQLIRPARFDRIAFRILYLVRTGAAMLLLEVLLHYFYYYSVISSPDALRLPPWETFFMVLFTMYEKFLAFYVFWRFSRGWALLDNMDPPENMNRCVNNNYTFAQFWRAWHSSYNFWVLRYLYIPLGGRQTILFNIWPIFLYVGVWHWMTWGNIAWAFLNCVFMTLEILVGRLCDAVPILRRVTHSRHRRFVVALGGLADVFLLMLANLPMMIPCVQTVLRIFSRLFFVAHDRSVAPVPFPRMYLDGWFLLLFIIPFVISNIMVMLEVRCEERRHGIFKPY